MDCSYSDYGLLFLLNFALFPVRMGMPDIIGLADSPLLRCCHAAAPALSPGIDLDPGSHIPHCSSRPCTTKQPGAVLHSQLGYLFQGKLGCHVGVPSFSTDDKILDNLGILNA